MPFPIHIALVATIVAGMGGAALAQTSSRGELQTQSSGSEAPRLRQPIPVDDTEARYKECMAHWDADTHMTRQEWSRTCRRVGDERVKYLKEHGYLPKEPKENKSK